MKVWSQRSGWSFLVFLFAVSAPQGQAACDQFLEGMGVAARTARLWGQEVTYTNVTTDERHPSKIFRDAAPNDLYVGFVGSHVYFVFHGNRYDGGPFYGATTIRRGNGFLSDGAVVRFRNLPTNLSERLMAMFSSFEEHRLYARSNSISCAYDVFATLSANGLKARGLTNFISSHFLGRLVLGGIRLKGGRVLKADVYLFGYPEDLETLVAQSVRVERRQQAAFAFLVGAGLLTSITSGVVHALFFSK